MTGVRIRITDGDVAGALSRLMTAAGDMRGALQNVGEAMQASTKKRIVAEKTPEGDPFEPLNAAYKAVEKKGPGILRESGDLFRSIVYQLGGEDQNVAIGTNLIYGAIHQFGGEIVAKNASALVFKLGGKVVHVESVEIPARPYLGISAEDRTEVLAIFADFFVQASGGVLAD